MLINLTGMFHPTVKGFHKCLSILLLCVVVLCSICTKTNCRSAGPIPALNLPWAKKVYVMYKAVYFRMSRDKASPQCWQWDYFFFCFSSVFFCFFVNQNVIYCAIAFDWRFARWMREVQESKIFTILLLHKFFIAGVQDENTIKCCYIIEMKREKVYLTIPLLAGVT